MKRVILLLLTLAMLFSSAGVLTGCRNASAHEVQFWTYDPMSVDGQKQVRDVIKAFESKTKISVSVSFVPRDSYRKKLDAAAADGFAPDVLVLDADYIPTYSDKDTGILMELNNYLRLSDVKGDELFENARRMNAIETKTFGVPFIVGCDVLLYNKALIDTADVPETWDDLLSCGKQAAQEKQVQAFAGLDDNTYAARCFEALVSAQSKTGLTNKARTETLFDTEISHRAAALLAELYKADGKSSQEQNEQSGKGSQTEQNSGEQGKGGDSKGGEQGKDEQSGKAGNTDGGAAQDGGEGESARPLGKGKAGQTAADAFGTGKAAFMVGDEADIYRLQKEFPDLAFGAAPVPKMDEQGDGAAVLRCTSLAMTRTAKQKTKAMKLIEFLAQPGNIQKCIEAGGGISAHKKEAKADVPAEETVLQQVENANPLPQLKGWAAVHERVLPSALGDILRGRDPADAMHEAAMQADDTLWKKDRAIIIK